MNIEKLKGGKERKSVKKAAKLIFNLHPFGAEMLVTTFDNIYSGDSRSP